MRSAEEATEYCNLLARAASAADALSFDAKDISCSVGYMEAQSKIIDVLISAWRRDPHTILAVLNKLICKIEAMENDKKRLYAVAICKWMDENCSLDECKDDISFSLNALFPIASNQFMEFFTLNTNFVDIGIGVIPNFPTRIAYRKEEDTEPVRLANRDIFDGINGELNSIKLVPRIDGIDVRHILLMQTISSNQAFRCAFSPLSDKKDLLEFERVKVVRGGREYDGISLQKIRYEAELQQAFETQWRMAAEAGVHLFFAPEMLCTDMLAEEINGYNTVVRRLSRDMRKAGLPVPFLTIMPSHSRSGTNTVTILDQNGRVIGRQRKLYPFRDVHMHAIEALTESPQHEIILIHLPGVHRIAILPCADLLTESPDYAHKIICGKLGATLIITPSYSGGEQDFKSMLPTFTPYGTSVLWGNCCGASKSSPHTIGGIHIAGLEKTEWYGNVCQCGGTCKRGMGCLFVADLPIRFTRNGPWDTHLHQLL